MAQLAGVWKLDKSDKFDDYLQKLGVNFVLRKAANSASPKTTITVEGNHYVIKTETTFKTTELKFNLGEETDEVRGDGAKVKSTTVAEGDTKLVQTQKGGQIDTSIIRELINDEMHMTLTAGDVVCTRVYKRVK